MIGPGKLFWLKQLLLPLSMPIVVDRTGFLKSRLLYVFGFRLARWTL